MCPSNSKSATYLVWAFITLCGSKSIASISFSKLRRQDKPVVCLLLSLQAGSWLSQNQLYQDVSMLVLIALTGCTRLIQGREGCVQYWDRASFLLFPCITGSGMLLSIGIWFGLLAPGDQTVPPLAGPRFCVYVCVCLHKDEVMCR